ncbi:MAG: AzlD domain-containing protein [Lentisphaeria bacterium]|nr:AzlD domain-containing protein [Lentisphaeria bacterium]
MARSDLLYTLYIVLAAGIVTILLRAFPFIAFGSGRRTPETVRYLGNVISPAAIAMLTVYCFFSHWQSSLTLYGIPELLAGGTAALLQYYKRNPLLSILAGTVIYMILVQNF